MQTGGVLLNDIAHTSAAVAGEPSRSAKTQLLAACLQRADPDEVTVVASYLSGELRQRRTGLGYAALRSLPVPADTPVLGVLDVDHEFATIAGMSGTGSTTRRRERFRDMLSRATESEQHLLAGLVSGELRQGALTGVLTEAVTVATGVPSSDIRRAVMVAGALVPVAAVALAEGGSGLARFRLTVGSPIHPMLAAPATDLDDALSRTGEAGIEWKIDGIRVQIHRDGSDVAVYTRTLDDITDQVPELVEAARALPVRAIVLDAETIALGPDGAPLPFQRTSARVSRKADTTRARDHVPLSLFAFDCLHLDGADLIGEPATKRWSALADTVPAEQIVARIVTPDLTEARSFFDRAVAAGHEGVVVKSLTVAYEAGRRGSGWLKVKPRHTLDLVVLAAEWGHGRRAGWLSNLHLGARDPDGMYGPPGGFVMLGKTFKGLTDTMLQWQTDHLLELADGPTDTWTVTMRPELAVEIAFDGVQTSTRYPASMALRFARVLRHRSDKAAAEADTVEAVRAIHRPDGGT